MTTSWRRLTKQPYSFRLLLPWELCCRYVATRTEHLRFGGKKWCRTKPPATNTYPMSRLNDLVGSHLHLALKLHFCYIPKIWFLGSSQNCCAHYFFSHVLQNCPLTLCGRPAHPASCICAQFLSTNVQFGNELHLLITWTNVSSAASEGVLVD